MKLLLLSLLLTLRAQATPVVEFYDATFVDRFLCRGKVAAEQANRDALIKLWKRWEKPLLDEAAKVMGRPWRRDVIHVGLFRCDSLPGWGYPLLVPMAPYASAPEHFVDAVFHEILHVPVFWNLAHRQKGAFTPLLKAHLGEPLDTLAHLHLNAVQKEVYNRLGRGDFLAAVVSRANHFPVGYARAWEILREEGHGPYLEELRSPANTHH